MHGPLAGRDSHSSVRLIEELSEPKCNGHKVEGWYFTSVWSECCQSLVGGQDVTLSLKEFRSALSLQAEMFLGKRRHMARHNGDYIASMYLFNHLDVRMAPRSCGKYLCALNSYDSYLPHCIHWRLNCMLRMSTRHTLYLQNNTASARAF